MPPGYHTYEYDGIGRRVAKLVNDGNNLEITLYISNDQQVLAEYNGSNFSNLTLARKYTYGEYVDEPLTITDHRNGANNTYYYHRNRQYSITALSDSTGQVIERYAYTPHGEATIFSSTGNIIPTSIVTNHTTFTGRDHDQETGLMYFRARMYDTLHGSFISRDPLHYVDGASVYLGYFVPEGMDPSGLEVYMCNRQFAGGMGYTTEDYRKYYRNGIHVYGFADINSLAHCYIKIEVDGKTYTYSWHPDKWAKDRKEAKLPRPGRVWINDPADLLNKDRAGVNLDNECLKLNVDDAASRKLIKYIEDWIKKEKSGLDEGEHKEDPDIKGNTIGKDKHEKCSKNSPTYKIDEFNCTKWSYQMITGSGIDVPEGVCDKCRKHNNGSGVPVPAPGPGPVYEPPIISE